ncbi:hypothetical protein ACFL1I_05845 [Candidatus Omnitrophota bacterium]
MRKDSLIFNFLLIIMLTMLGGKTLQAEIIYTKDGRQIKAKIDEVTVDTVWYELVVSEDVTEYLGIDRAEVEKIENDDGTAYNYSTTQKTKN